MTNGEQAAEAEETAELWEMLSRLLNSFKQRLAREKLRVTLQQLDPQKSSSLMTMTKTIVSEKEKVTQTENNVNESENIHSHVTTIIKKRK